MTTKTPRIAPANRDAITAILDEAQKGCRARLLDYSDVERAARDAEKRLEALPKRLRVGATASYDPWSVAKAYKFSAEGTAITLRRNTQGWTLISASRSYVQASAYGAGAGLDLRVRLAKGVDAEDLLAALLRRAEIER